MSYSGVFAAREATLRDTLKWLVASFTGAGALLFSGLSVASITLLATQNAWLIPVTLAALPIVSAAACVWIAHWVLNAQPPQPSELFPQFWSRQNPGLPPPQGTKPTYTKIQANLPPAVA